MYEVHEQTAANMDLSFNHSGKASNISADVSAFLLPVFVMFYFLLAVN